MIHQGTNPILTVDGKVVDCKADEIEPLHKVLPAGGPMVSRGWTCPVCGVTRPDGQPQRCNSFNCLRDICPVMGSHT